MSTLIETNRTVIDQKELKRLVNEVLDLPRFEESVDPDSVSVSDVYYVVNTVVGIAPKACKTRLITTVTTGTVLVANYRHDTDEARLSFDYRPTRSKSMGEAIRYTKAFTTPRTKSIGRRMDYFYTKAAAKRAQNTITKRLNEIKAMVSD